MEVMLLASAICLVSLPRVNLGDLNVYKDLGVCRMPPYLFFHLKSSFLLPDLDKKNAFLLFRNLTSPSF